MLSISCTFSYLTTHRYYPHFITEETEFGEVEWVIQGHIKWQNWVKQVCQSSCFLSTIHTASRTLYFLKLFFLSSPQNPHRVLSPDSHTAYFWWSSSVYKFFSIPTSPTPQVSGLWLASENSKDPMWSLTTEKNPRNDDAHINQRLQQLLGIWNTSNWGS